MVRHNGLRLSLLYICLVAVILLAHEAVAPGYEPEVGQHGKDVAWVPSPPALVDKMLEMAGVTPEDYVIDLGSGDGRTVIAAAKRGARALGVEFNPDLVDLAKQNAVKEGVAGKAQFIRADLFETDLSQATIITMFLLPGINLQLQPRLLELKPGTRIISNSFDLGEWEEDAKETVENNCSSYCTAFLWIVPAKVEGKWTMPHGEMMLKQSFQKVWGTVKIGEKEKFCITEGLLNGDNISLRAGNLLYRGKVKGNQIDGTFTSGETISQWNATRKGLQVKQSAAVMSGDNASTRTAP